MKFKPLTTAEGLSNNSVNDLVSDRYGRLWIATWDGLNVYDGSKVQVFKHQLKDSTSLSGNAVLGLMRDGEQTIWVFTDNQTVSAYRGDGHFENYRLAENPFNLRLTKAGRLAVETDQGYLAFNGAGFKRIAEDQIQQQEDLGVLKHFLLQEHPQLIINDVFKDSEGNIWYATRSNGLYIIPNTPQNIGNEVIAHYVSDLYAPYSFTSDEIEKIYQDDLGNIWLAHKDGGVSMAYTGAEQITTIVPHPVKYPHLPSETIRAITKDASSAIWLGYYTKGLFKYSNTTHCFLPYAIKEAEKNNDWNRVRSLFTDSKGVVWVGTYAGLIAITNSGYQLYRSETNAHFPANRNYAMYEDQTQQKLWVGCWGGLGKLNLQSKKFEAFEHQEDLNVYHIRHVIKHGDTLVLATEDDGVLFFSEKEGVIKQISVRDGVLGNSIYSIQRDDRTGYYWIATLGGVSVYDLKKGVIKNISEADGLPSHMVYSLLANGDKMWISTTKGIATISKTDYTVFQLPYEEGWQAEEFSEGAAYQDAKQMLFFGGISGFSYLQPDAYHYTSKPPKLFTKIDGQERYAPELNKAYSDNTLSIHLTPVNFSKVYPPVYYRLEGYDDQWKQYKNQEIHYANLHPGTYVLHTRVGADVNSITRQVSVVIAAPFYETIWFYVLCGILAVLVSGGYSFRKNKRVKETQRELEAKIKERTLVIESQKETLQQNNEELQSRHKELNTQKEQILSLHHQLKNRDFEVDKFKTFVLSNFKPKLNKIITALQELQDLDNKGKLEQELLALIQNLTEWDYLDQVTSLAPIQATQIHFKEFIERVYNQVRKNRITGDTYLEFEIKTATDVLEIDVLRFKLLYQYLLNEILKYGDSQNALRLNTTLEAAHLYIQITSDSKLLQEQWESITKYSPYYKAFKTLLDELDGSIETATTGFKAQLRIPVVNVAQVTDQSGVLMLKHLENEDGPIINKPSILVFCELGEQGLVQSLLQEISYRLVFEHELQALPSALQQLNVKALVVYNALFSAAFATLISKPSFRQLPSLYIAEQINLDEEAQIMESGINTLVHLPVNKGFIQKKVTHLLQQQPQVAKSGVTAVLEESDDMATSYNPNEKLVKQALIYIRAELGNPNFNVDKLIEVMDISRTKCYRSFKAVLQQSPSDVISSLRLQKAEQLLLAGTLNISEISFECGFNDPKYFSRMFKKHYGASPKQYKQKHI